MNSTRSRTIPDYESCVRSDRNPATRWIAAVVGLLVGECASAAQLIVLQSGGPIFPMTVLYAPAHIFVEWSGDDRVLYLTLFVLGPMLVAAYTLLAVSKRFLALALCLALHLACFTVTLWQRDVASVL